MSQLERYRQAKKTTIIGAIINLGLGCIKLAGGIAYHSHALIADGAHSFSDLVTDVLVIFASKYGSQDADTMHPYGHQRIETAATLILAMLLILAGAGIAWDSLSEIIQQTATKPQLLALPIAVLSILANEILFYYTRRIGERIHSPLLVANAWHHRSDAGASGIVLAGIIGSYFGITLLDPCAAIIIGFMIIKMGINYAWNSVKELVDTGIEPKKIAEIEGIIRNVPGVKKIHQLRNRMMGKDIYIDVHILISPFISVSEGHYIAQHVHHALIQKISQVKDVTVHVDPEDDELESPSFNLPNRQTIQDELVKNWIQMFPSIQSWLVHYLDGKITIDLETESSFKDLKALNAQIQQDIANYPAIWQVNVLKHMASIVRDAPTLEEKSTSHNPKGSS